jgi:2'-5' RNA ligase
MRLFIAIDIDEKNKAALSDLQTQLRSKADVKKGDVKWVSVGNIHLTLKFLGEVEEDKLPEICMITEDVASSHEPFDLSIESVGHFGGKSATVLWVGTGEGTQELLQLQKDLETGLASAGWPAEERLFSGHLTLARIKNPKAGFKIPQLAQQYKNFELGVLSVDSINVYKSQLTPDGPVYTLLGNYKLK